MKEQEQEKRKGMRLQELGMRKEWVLKIQREQQLGMVKQKVWSHQQHRKLFDQHCIQKHQGSYRILHRIHWIHRPYLSNLECKIDFLKQDWF